MKRLKQLIQDYHFQASHLVLIFAFLTGLVGVLNFITLYDLYKNSQLARSFPLELIIADLIIISIIFIYLIIKLRIFIKIRRKDDFSFKFRTKVILILSFFCFAPVLIVFMLSLSFFNIGSKSWFNSVIDRALNESMQISKIYIAEHHEKVADDLFHIKKYAEKNTKDILLTPTKFDSSFSGKAATLSLTEAIIFVYNKENNSTKILSKTDFSFVPSIDKLDFVKNYQPNDLGYNLIFSEDDNYIRAITKISTMPNTYILVGRLINDKVVRHIKNAEDAHAGYGKLKEQLKNLQTQTAIVFILVILLILLALILFALNYSAKILNPIFEIVLATRKISRGDYNVKLQDQRNSYEISSLIKSFNHMAKLVGQQNSHLNLSNKIINSKKEFLESVLGNMPIATIILDSNNKIKLFNKTAEKLLNNYELNDLDISIIIPKFNEIGVMLHASPDKIIAAETTIKNNDEKIRIKINVSLEKSMGEINGYIVNMYKL
jgi:two-component system nitrogen regulation sensor histidine kinase NtrY